MLWKLFFVYVFYCDPGNKSNAWERNTKQKAIWSNCGLHASTKGVRASSFCICVLYVVCAKNVCIQLFSVVLYDYRAVVHMYQ